MTKTTLALCALAAAFAAVASSASAAQPAGARILIADLDFSSPMGVASFRQRVQAVATHLCMGANQPLELQTACRTAVREEAVANLGYAQQRSLRLAANRSDSQTAGF